MKTKKKEINTCREQVDRCIGGRIERKWHIPGDASYDTVLILKACGPNVHLTLSFAMGQDMFLSSRSETPDDDSILRVAAWWSSLSVVSLHRRASSSEDISTGRQRRMNDYRGPTADEDEEKSGECVGRVVTRVCGLPIPTSETGLVEHRLVAQGAPCTLFTVVRRVGCLAHTCIGPWVALFLPGYATPLCTTPPCRAPSFVFGAKEIRTETQATCVSEQTCLWQRRHYSASRPHCSSRQSMQNRLLRRSREQPLCLGPSRRSTPYLRPCSL